MLFRVQLLVLISFFVWMVDAQNVTLRVGGTHDTITCKKDHGSEPDPYEKCSNYFYQCDEYFIGYRTRCQNDLYYDWQYNQCLQWIDVPECTGLTREYTTTTKHPTRIPDDQSLFDCVKARPGNYADERGTIFVGDKRVPFCSNRYFTCSNGILTISYCPAGNFFDQPHNECGHSADIFDCNGGITITRPPTTIAPKVSTEDLHFSCLNKKGIFPVEEPKCSHNFIFCPDGGWPVKGECQANLYYNRETFRCEEREVIFDCNGGVRPTTTLRPTWPTEKPYFFDCNGLVNGHLYPDPEKACSNIFFECANGHGWKLKCADDPLDRTAFDVEKQRCDYKKYVPACNGVTPKPVSTMTAASTTTTTPTTTTTTLPTTTWTPRMGRSRTTSLEPVTTTRPTTRRGGRTRRPS